MSNPNTVFPLFDFSRCKEGSGEFGKSPRDSPNTLPHPRERHWDLGKETPAGGETLITLSSTSPWIGGKGKVEKGLRPPLSPQRKERLVVVLLPSPLALPLA